MTIGGLIHNLTVFADFYEQASADIHREEGATKPWYIGNRDANADVMQRDFRATVAIDRVRAYVLAKYGADLTIGTARRLLGDLIRLCALTVKAAEELTLEGAMDKLEAAESRRDDAVIFETKGARRRRTESGPVANSPHARAIVGSVRKSGGAVSNLSANACLSQFSAERRPGHGPVVIRSAKGRWSAGGRRVEHRRNQQDGLWPQCDVLRYRRRSNHI